MIDRGMIKWMPFDSCYSSKKILNELKKEREKEVFPALSDDQILNISEKIKKAYELRCDTEITFFYNDKLNKIKGKITSIDQQEKKIYINNKAIYLSQVLKVS